MTAANILKNALGHMQDRAATYDKPDGERSMGATVDAFKAVTGVLMTEEQGWLFMSLLKAVRSQQGAYRADSYEDGAAYFALAGESAANERAAVDRMAASFGQQNMIDPADVDLFEEPASLIDDESPRANAIGQNGNTGEHYDDPWAGAPEWAKYKAQDYDGEWYWFESEPGAMMYGWASGEGDAEVVHLDQLHPDNPYWGSTLISR